MFAVRFSQVVTRNQKDARSSIASVSQLASRYAWDLSSVSILAAVS